jgi:hypothetical protein
MTTMGTIATIGAKAANTPRVQIERVKIAGMRIDSGATVPGLIGKLHRALRCGLGITFKTVSALPCTIITAPSIVPVAARQGGPKMAKLVFHQAKCATTASASD